MACRLYKFVLENSHLAQQLYENARNMRCYVIKEFFLFTVTSKEVLQLMYSTALHFSK